MRTLAITIAYDGTRYVGWQRQPAGESIQQLLESAVAAIEQRPVTVTGAGRTDAGVHALGQVASFVLEHGIPCETLPRALNARLPEDVRVLRAEERPAGFSARYVATAKHYRYVLLQGPTVDPFDARFAWHVPVPLDTAAMAEALEALAGRHDFASFCAAGSEVKSTVRTLRRVSCVAVPARAAEAASWRPVATAEPRIVIDLEGEGFLRHMVRNIAGTLVEIGKGRWPPVRMGEVLAARDRRDAGPTAPPQGLCLVGVEYGDSTREAAGAAG